MQNLPPYKYILLYFSTTKQLQIYYRRPRPGSFLYMHTSGNIPKRRLYFTQLSDICLCNIVKIYKERVGLILHEYLFVRKLFASSGPKFTSYRWFWERFKAVSARLIEIFASMCNNGRNLEPPLHCRVQSAVTWILNRRAKTAAISWWGYGARVLEFVWNFYSSTIF